ncbi:hypothetical protein PPERSA_09980 [Pseudocohnilembus persalinus]|uniref:Uncharacterized protein n=1 Tax=Pseudocohnilembus persalinus TaxID=266149 RepID=A0A0V0QJK8_PSEPJ|nr:hypothetical protein PPERSA_09980 [Pseudocohnilembus persalinus]|eukprot:KRX02363.1 hypothetical protein PPERSA_09980 [Pseudocohnilembus persalinus]
MDQNKKGLVKQMFNVQPQKKSETEKQFQIKNLSHKQIVKQPEIKIETQLRQKIDSQMQNSSLAVSNQSSFSIKNQKNYQGQSKYIKDNGREKTLFRNQIKLSEQNKSIQIDYPRSSKNIEYENQSPKNHRKIWNRKKTRSQHSNYENHGDKNNLNKKYSEQNQIYKNKQKEQINLNQFNCDQNYDNKPLNVQQNGKINCIQISNHSYVSPNKNQSIQMRIKKIGNNLHIIKNDQIQNIIEGQQKPSIQLQNKLKFTQNKYNDKSSSLTKKTRNSIQITKINTKKINRKQSLQFYQHNLPEFSSPLSAQFKRQRLLQSQQKNKKSISKKKGEKSTLKLKEDKFQQQNLGSDALAHIQQNKVQDNNFYQEIHNNEIQLINLDTSQKNNDEQQYLGKIKIDKLDRSISISDSYLENKNTNLTENQGNQSNLTRKQNNNINLDSLFDNEKEIMQIQEIKETNAQDFNDQDYTITNEYYLNNAVCEDDFINQVETGDLILMKTDNFQAQMQSYFTRSKYDHIGIIYKNKQRGYVYVFDSLPGLGVRKTEWINYIHRNNLFFKVMYRPLIFKDKYSNKFIQILEQFMEESIGTTYDWGIKKMLRKNSFQFENKFDQNYDNVNIQKTARQNKDNQQLQDISRTDNINNKNSLQLNKNKNNSNIQLKSDKNNYKLDNLNIQNQNQQNQEGVFCSELVAKFFKKIGIIDKDKQSTSYWPVHFTEKRNLQLQQGATLGQETIIVLDRHVIQNQY